MRSRTINRLIAFLTLGAAALVPAYAGAQSLEAAFDRALGTETRAPRDYTPTFASPLEQRIAAVAAGGNGRIGVAAIDLSTGEQISILGDQRFPLASTSKIAIAATFLEGVDQGRWSLSSAYPLMVPVRSARFSGSAAPVVAGERLPAIELIELMLTRSSNPATDALLAVVGGPKAVTSWVRRAGIQDFRIDRDIATLVRDDGEVDPSTQIDLRDSASPKAMLELLTGLDKGRWLSRDSRDVLMGAMERCRTGKRRIRGLMPSDVTVAHKTGSLSNTSSDIGIIKTAEGRSIAVAIYVTGQGSKDARESRIAEIARAIYDGYVQDDYVQPGVMLISASYSPPPSALSSAMSPAPKVTATRAEAR